MTVFDLIMKLKDLPAKQEVVLDVTQEGAEFYSFATIEEIIEIESPEGEKYISLSPYYTTTLLQSYN